MAGYLFFNWEPAILIFRLFLSHINTLFTNKKGGYSSPSTLQLSNPISLALSGPKVK